MSREEIMEDLLNEDLFGGGEMLTVNEYYQRMLGYHQIEEDRRQAESSKNIIRSILQKWERGTFESGYPRAVTRESIYSPKGRPVRTTCEKRHDDACYSLQRR